MPRTARIKPMNAIFHIMIRSISEVDLFKKDVDKEEYLSTIKRYKDIYGFQVYGYCLMTNHGHIIINTNGADISKVMHSINFTYSIKFNKRYERRGHLYQGRFTSKVVNTEGYLLTLSAYVHNNPRAIKGYENCPEKYKYSSLSIYLGLNKDDFEIVDEDFVLKLFGEDVLSARRNYYIKIFRSTKQDLLEEIEFTSEKTKYVSESKVLVRDVKPEEIISYVSERLGVDKSFVYMKYSRVSTMARALAMLLMRGICNFSCKKISQTFGNITQSRISKLCSIARESISSDGKYKDFIENFIAASSRK